MRRWQALTRVGLFVSLALVMARAMQLETLRDPFDVQLASESIARGPGAASGVVLDLLCCVPALLVLLRRLLDPAFATRSTLSHALLGALAIWTAATSFWASDKFAAAVLSAHFISAVVLLWAVSQIIREWWHLRLVAGICLGLLLVYVAHGLVYKLVDLPAMRESVQKNWPKILEERGWEEGSFSADQFKKKVLSGELIGFGSSPNTYAAMIVMLGFAAAGLAMQRWRDRDEWGWPAFIAPSLIVAVLMIWLTQSRTALMTPLLGIAILAVAWGARGLLIRKRITIFSAAVAAFLLLGAALVGHGIKHGTLFHDSLTFRWRYWSGAFQILRAHPLLGVGFDNFSSYYLGVRLPIASEEVHDPHNFIVRFFVETGIVGGALLLGWLARAWWEMTTPHLPAESNRHQHASVQTLPMILWLAASAVFINILCAVDLAQIPSYVFIEVLKRILYLGLLVIGCVAGSIRSTRAQQLDERPAPLLLYSLIVAIALFLIHNLIDFSMFDTGPMFVLMLLIGTVLGLRTPQRIPASRRASISAFAIALVGWLLAGVGFVAPIVASEMTAQQGDEALRAGQPRLAAAKLRSAREMLWIPNADYSRRAARALMYANAPVGEIRSTLDVAIAADPMNLGALNLRANFEISLPHPDIERAIGDFERLLKLNPNDVQTRLDFAKALEKLALPQPAAEQYRLALHYDDLLAHDEPKRLSPQRRQEIQREIDRLQ